MRPTPVFDNEFKARLFRLSAIFLGLGLLFIGCLTVIHPFIPAIMLAAILTLATWPAFLWVEDRVGHRTTIAAVLMTILLAVLFIVPLALLGTTLVESFRLLVGAVTETLSQKRPIAPEWLREIPIVGSYLDGLWQEYAMDREKALQLVQGHAGTISNWLLITVAAIGRGVFDISLAVIISFFLFRNGVNFSARISALMERALGQRGESLLKLTKGTLVGVIYGILGTAVIQGVIASIGFLIAGVPGAALLGVLTTLSAPVPVGPPLIWGAATLWLVSQNEITMAIFMALWGGIMVSSLDNVVRLYFISLGARLPLLIILLGVFGGLLAFGFIGLFVGPTLLAIAYNLFIEWSSHQHPLINPPPPVIITPPPPRDPGVPPASPKPASKPAAKPKAASKTDKPPKPKG
jgi:predicted PurR-regulated permease PerM